MKINKVKDTKEMLHVELEGETHTLANAVREELYEDKSVEGAAYMVKHPLVSNPELIVKGKNPKKSLKDAAGRLSKKSKEFRDAFKKTAK
jgi:DNA-directed RNA polymerase subunit L